MGGYTYSDNSRDMVVNISDIFPLLILKPISSMLSTYICNYLPDGVLLVFFIFRYFLYTDYMLAQMASFHH